MLRVLFVLEHAMSTIGSGDAYAYLHALMHRSHAASGNAEASRSSAGSLMDAFYPSATQPAANSNTPVNAAPEGSFATCASGSMPGALTTDTLGALIAMQGQQSPADRVSARAEAVFKEFDADGNGGISQTEFQNAFGSSADQTKVNDLFKALDTDGDGAISQSELTSAAQASAAHHHHRHHGGSGGPGGDPLASMMNSLQGASTQSSTNADGSKTTTITFADGSTVSMTAPPSQSSDGGSSGSGNSNGYNVLEQLIQQQAKMLMALGASASANSSTTAAVVA